jgi:CheY-like chemotaxis protein
MRFLIVEDDEDKLNDLVAFIKEETPTAEISVARSHGSGLRKIIFEADVTDLLIMDMSMPSFDVSLQEPTGGVPENYAGEDLLAQMKLRMIETPTIFVTMFDEFGEKPNKIPLSELAARLRSNFSPPFCDLVYYSSRQEGWRMSLRESIKKALNTKK